MVPTLGASWGGAAAKPHGAEAPHPPCRVCASIQSTAPAESLPQSLPPGAQPPHISRPWAVPGPKHLTVSTCLQRPGQRFLLPGGLPDERAGTGGPLHHLHHPPAQRQALRALRPGTWAPSCPDTPCPKLPHGPTAGKPTPARSKPCSDTSGLAESLSFFLELHQGLR